MYWVPT
jgi:hypothetical protein